MSLEDDCMRDEGKLCCVLVRCWLRGTAELLVGVTVALRRFCVVCVFTLI